MGNNRQGAAEIRHFWNNPQKHHTCKNPQHNKRHTGVNEMKLPCQLLLRTWPRWGFLCFTQAVFSPLVPGYWEGYISQAGWMEWRGAERSVGSQTAHFTPGVTDLSYDFTHSAHTECDFYNVIFYPLCKTKKIPDKTSAHFYLVWTNCHVSFNLSLSRLLLCSRLICNQISNINI